jgi:hypothetical protein
MAANFQFIQQRHHHLTLFVRRHRLIYLSRWHELIVLDHLPGYCSTPLSSQQKLGRPPRATLREVDPIPGTESAQALAGQGRAELPFQSLLPLPSQGSVAQGMDTGCQSTDGCLAPVLRRYAFDFIDHVPK